MLREVAIRYVPHSKQQLFHNDRYTVPFRLISAGTGSGKTFCGVFEILSWLIENNGCVGYIFEPTFRMVRRILIPTLQRFLGFPLESSPLIQEFRRTESHIVLHNGSHLWFGGLEDPEMSEGPNIDVVQVDEARLIRHFDVAWKVIQRRIRGSIPNKYPTGAFITTTPPPLIPEEPIYDFFENPKTKHPDSKVYRWSVFDNKKNLPSTYIDNIRRAHTGGLAERFIYGRFAGAGEGSFEFDVTKHVLEPNQLPEKFIKIVYGVDFGWTNPCTIMVIGFDGDYRAYVLDEFYQSRVPVETMIDEAKRMRIEYGEGTFYCDPSEPRTIEQFCRAGLDAVGNKIKRDAGIRELGGRLKVAGDGKPRFFVCSRCVNLISELQIYDERVKENDHSIDGTRYGVANMTQAYDQPFKLEFGKRP